MRKERFFATLTLLLLAGVVSASAGTVFEDDFKGHPVGKPLAPGPITLTKGEWSKMGKQVKSPNVVLLDGEPVLEFRTSESLTGGARAIASFRNEAGEPQPVEGPLKVRLQFQVSGDLNDTLYISVHGGDGKARAVVTMDAGGVLNPSFAGEREQIGQRLEPGKWYYLEFVLPAKPKTKSRYTVNLCDSDGISIIESREGLIARSVEENGNNYTGVDIQHKVPGQSLYLKSIKVEETE